ncbi:hypothetical protein PPGU16_82310 (plasmid) [Paraburkholderia largidicola]|uniref:Uncharacterized protein n=1 Tax=Paraburkholderia largidicola TaxID=3014751 RepID=A0A7I8C2A8_9BURK|nr:hypothetical protein PPGU16_82310 [Paraburkholderia sp. PGU16]
MTWIGRARRVMGTPDPVDTRARPKVPAVGLGSSDSGARKRPDNGRFRSHLMSRRNQIRRNTDAFVSPRSRPGVLGYFVAMHGNFASGTWVRSSADRGGAG